MKLILVIHFIEPNISKLLSFQHATCNRYNDNYGTLKIFVLPSKSNVDLNIYHAVQFELATFQIFHSHK